MNSSWWALHPRLLPILTTYYFSIKHQSLVRKWQPSLPEKHPHSLGTPVVKTAFSLLLCTAVNSQSRQLERMCKGLPARWNYFPQPKTCAITNHYSKRTSNRKTKNMLSFSSICDLRDLPDSCFNGMTCGMSVGSQEWCLRQVAMPSSTATLWGSELQHPI